MIKMFAQVRLLIVSHVRFQSYGPLCEAEPKFHSTVSREVLASFLTTMEHRSLDTGRVFVVQEIHWLKDRGVFR